MRGSEISRAQVESLCVREIAVKMERMNSTTTATRSRAFPCLAFAAVIALGTCAPLTASADNPVEKAADATKDVVHGAADATGHVVHGAAEATKDVAHGAADAAVDTVHGHPVAGARDAVHGAANATHEAAHGTAKGAHSAADGAAKAADDVTR